MARAEIVGVSELRRTLASIDKTLGKDLGKLHGKVGDEVIKIAKANPGGGVAGHVARSDLLKSSKTANKAKIRIGRASKSSPGPGAEVGSKKFAQFGAYIGERLEDGRVVGRVIAENSEEITDIYGLELEQLWSDRGATLG